MRCAYPPYGYHSSSRRADKRSASANAQHSTSPNLLSFPPMTTPEPFDHKRFLSNTTQQPGIYQMYDAEGELLYVGKAKNLKKRLASYFRSSGL